VTGSDLPTWTFFTVAAFLGVAAVFLHQFADWLWSLHQNKKLKHFLGLVLLAVILVWLGWPWQRINNLFAEISPKQPLITEKWMSEQEAEQFVTSKLRSDGNLKVFDRRVRYLLKKSMADHRIGRFLCEGDSVWQPLGDLELYQKIGKQSYDGTQTLSEFIGCTVQYSTENIYLTDWVVLNRNTGVTPLSPD